MDMADLITFLTIDKEIHDGVVVNKKVFMNFRSDGFIDCGGRFKGLPDKVGYGAKNYLSVFENAVKASMLKPKDENELNELEELKKIKKLTQEFINELNLI
jgi:hypothetical protein